VYVNVMRGKKRTNDTYQYVLFLFRERKTVHT
jgi:hypothetical protein